jgi:hypothetical protein
MQCRRLILLLTVSVFSFASAAHAADAKKITYEEHVKPIFRAKCFSCHNTDKKTADLDLSSYTAMMIGGASGAPIEPGIADDSYLFNLVNHDSEPYMPPKQEKMAAASIDTIRKWIDGGALENSASKVMVKKKTNDFALKGAPTGKPDGPAAMPDVLTLQPFTAAQTTTAVTALATSPWAPLIAVAGQKQVTLYHSQTLQPLGILSYPEGIPHVLKFSRNGSLLLAGGGRGSFQGRVVVWDVRSGERIFEVGDEVDTVLAADISADQSMIALGSPSKVVRVYSTSDGELLYEIRKHTDWIYSLEFSPDGILLATSDRNGGLHVWEALTGREYLTLNGHKGAVTCVSFRSDSNVLASASEDQTVKLWEMENGKQIKTWNAHGGGTSSVEFCRDGRVATCGRDRVTKLWDQNGKQLRAFEAFGDLALQVTHCDETDRMIAGDWTGAVRVWNVADGKRLGELNQNPPTLDVRIAASQAALKNWNAQSVPRNAALTSTQAGLTAIQTQLNQATQSIAAATKTQQTVKPQIDAQNKLIAQLKPIVDSNTKREAVLRATVPQLTTAATNAEAAAKQIATDKALAAAVAAIKQQVVAKQADLTKTTQLLAAKRKDLATATTQVAALNKQMSDANTLLAASKKKQAEMTPKMKPAQDSFSKAKLAADEAIHAIQTTTTDVAKWHEYKALHSELTVLAERQQELDGVAVAAAEAEAGLKEAQTAVAASEKAATDITAQMKASDDKTAQMQAAIKQHQSEQVAATTKVDQINKTLPVLDQSLAKARQASQLLADDKEIAAAVAQLAKAIAANKAGVPVLQKQIADKKATMDAAAKAVSELATAKVELTKTLTITSAEVAAKKAAMAPVQMKVATAKQQVAAVTARLDEARNTVENRRQRIRPTDQKQANAN